MIRSLTMPALVLAMSCCVSQEAVGDPIRFDDPAWVIRGEGAKVEEHLGRNALRLRTGIAFLPDLSFENGTIEFEMMTSGRRSFIGVRFRMEPGGDCEYVYFRPHNAGKWDAMQYTPVDHGQTAWQLYSGEGYSAAAPIPSGRWIPVRLEVAGSRAEVYVDRNGTPALIVTDLKRGRSRGGIGLYGLFPGEGSDDHYPTAFANLSVTPREIEAVYNPRTPPPAGSGIVGSWSTQPPFRTPEEPIRELKEEWIDPQRWIRIASEASGIVNFATIAARPEGARRTTILARVLIHSERRQVKKLNFGFSDRGDLFLNRAPLFSGDNTYRSRSPRYLGVMTIDHEAVYLPLREGENELVFAVTEAFGGWGLIARLEDLDGITLHDGLPGESVADGGD